jgi:hypothetical protein
MPSDKIINYYLLCKIRDRALPIVNNISDKNFDVLFTKKQVTMYLRERDNKYIIKEYIIGGEEPIPITGGNIIIFE